MNSTKLEKIKEANRLPKDELDSFWENFLCYFLIFFGLVISILRLNLETITNIDNIFVIIMIALGIYTVWSKINERNLFKIRSGLNLSDNRKMIKLFADNPKWILKKSKNSYWEFTVTSLFKIPTHTNW
jgi:hypothetical protein